MRVVFLVLQLLADASSGVGVYFVFSEMLHCSGTTSAIVAIAATAIVAEIFPLKREE